MKHLSLTAGLLLVACGGAATTQSTTYPPTNQLVFGGTRPATLHVPSGYDNSEPIPLIVVLHGYNATGELQSLYLGMDQLVDEANVLLIAPNGEPNKQGTLFWNATDACCNFDGTGVDDVGYLTRLIQEISSVYNVDQKRIYLVGHSNGGFMAYRMACDRADMIAGIVSLAGATWYDATQCDPSEPVNVLQIHGTLDSIILYPGGSIFKQYPGAEGSVDRWSKYDHCSGSLAPQLQILNLAVGLPTTVQTETGCADGINVDLWSIVGGSHVPLLTDEFRTDVWHWLRDHHKP